MSPAPDFDSPSLALVGNAPDIGDCARAIDAAACVVRFNNAPGFGGSAGSRVTLLALVNRGGQARSWVEEAGFGERPIVRQAQAYVLPFPELSPDEESAQERVCWTHPLRARLAGRTIHVLSPALHAAARRVLAPYVDGTPNPSTGFLVAFAILARRSRTLPPIDVYGFGFAGWSGHPWKAERICFDRWGSTRRLRLHPTIGHSGGVDGSMGVSRPRK